MEQEPTHPSSRTNAVLLPASILVAALLISGTIIWSTQRSATNVAAGLPPEAAEEQAGDLEAMTPVTDADHIRGNPDAPVKLVEYSDTECPFCKQFHGTLREVMDTYGKEGKVAWIYRHLPLDQLHAKARKEAVATECAAEQGGDEAFFAYLDRLFAITPSNDGLDAAELPKIAQYVGLDTAKFSSCLASGKYDAHIEAEAQNANATGGSGTPWTIVVGPDGKKYPLSGALPLSSVTALIDTALGN